MSLAACRGVHRRRRATSRGVNARAGSMGTVSSLGSTFPGWSVLSQLSLAALWPSRGRRARVPATSTARGLPRSWRSSQIARRQPDSPMLTFPSKKNARAVEVDHAAGEAVQVGDNLTGSSPEIDAVVVAEGTELVPGTELRPGSGVGLGDRVAMAGFSGCS